MLPCEVERQLALDLRKSTAFEHLSNKHITIIILYYMQLPCLLMFNNFSIVPSPHRKIPVQVNVVVIMTEYDARTIINFSFFFLPPYLPPSPPHPPSQNVCICVRTG